MAKAGAPPLGRDDNVRALKSLVKLPGETITNWLHLAGECKIAKLTRLKRMIQLRRQALHKSRSCRSLPHGHGQLRHGHRCHHPRDQGAQARLSGCPGALPHGTFNGVAVGSNASINVTDDGANAVYEFKR